MVALAAASAALAAWLLINPGVTRLATMGTPRRTGLLTPPRGGLRGQHRAAVGVAVGLVGPLLVAGRLGILVGAAIGLMGFAFAAWLPASGSRRLAAALVAEQPIALDFLSVALSAGLPLSIALRRVAEISPPATKELLARMGTDAALGRLDSAGWRELPGAHAWRGVAQDLARSQHSGTTLADSLALHSQLSRQRLSDGARQRAKRVGVQIALPLMLCFLPAFLAVGVAPMVVGLLSGFLLN